MRMILCLNMIVSFLSAPFDYSLFVVIGANSALLSTYVRHWATVKVTGSLEDGVTAWRALFIFLVNLLFNFADEESEFQNNHSGKKEGWKKNVRTGIRKYNLSEMSDA